MENEENAVQLSAIAYILNEIGEAKLENDSSNHEFKASLNMLKNIAKNALEIFVQNGISLQDAEITISSKGFKKIIKVKADDFLVQSTEG